VFDVVVLGTPAVRSDLTGFGNILIDSPTSGSVPLADVASVTVNPEPTAIIHDDVVRSIDVAATVTGDPGSVAADVESRLTGIDMPYEYHAQVFSNAVVARSDLLRVLGLGAGVLVGVFLLLQAAALGWRRAGLVLLSLPLALAGGVLAAPLAGGVWGLGALVGLLTVLALALRHGSVLVADVRRIEQDDADGPVPAVWQAARSRVQPVVRTVLLTLAALLPALVLGPRAGLELLFPLAVTVAGGLVSLLLVQLVVLPGLLATTSAPRRVIELPSEPAAALVSA
jgi:Cu/Ag efflux pump CusA